MSEQTPPRQGDTVRVVLEGRVNNVTDKTIVVETDRNYMPLPLVDISVEVLERADDPDQDEICTVRRGPDGELAVATETEHNHEDIRYRWRLLAAGDRRPTSMLIPSERVVGWPVVWSPAAEAERVTVPADETAVGPAERCQQDLADALQVDVLPWPALMDIARRRSTAQEEYPKVSGSGAPHPPLDNEGIETGLYFAEKARRRAAGEVV